MPFLAWYLAAMKQASTKAGKRLLDLVDVHFYPQGQADGQSVYGGKSSSPAMQALRLRSTRCLWDRSYRDESWINEPVALIPRVKDWIEKHDPGTRLCVGEYSWGGDDDASGAVAQAELLGIFAREQVDYAYYWAGLEGVQKFAFQLYRNPDGRHQGFGERFLSCRSSDPDRLSVFAARRADGATTTVLVNKDARTNVQARLHLGKTASLKATLYRLPNPPGPITKQALKGHEDDQPVVLPALSAVMIVIPGGK